MLRASIYDPGRGDSENIAEQLLFHYGEDTPDEQLKQIGVAQGLAELTHSIDGTPVKWIRTLDNLSVLVQVEISEKENWRNGIWVYAAVGLDECPEFVLCSLRDAYHQFALLRGTFAYCLANNVSFADYWTDFFTAWSPPYTLGALAAPRYLRLCSGVVSPDVIQEIEDIRAENDFSEILVCSATDYAFYWPGKYLELGTRADLQNMLLNMPPIEEPQNKNGPGSNSGSSTASIYHKSPSPEAQAQAQAQAPAQSASIPPESETLDSQRQSSWGLDQLSSYLPSISMPTSASFSGTSAMFSRSNMPSMPSMQSIHEILTGPSVPKFDSFKKPFEQMGTYFSPTPKPHVPVSRVIHTIKLMIQDKQHYLIAYQKHDFVFCFISPHEFSLNRHLERGCSLVARDLEGMSYAADPPNTFDYMVLNSSAKTLTSTLKAPSIPEDVQVHQLIVRTMFRGDNVSKRRDNKIMRTASNWWIHHNVFDENTEAIFCKKSTDPDMSQLIGANTATDEWVTSYRRRRGF